MHPGLTVRMVSRHFQPHLSSKPEKCRFKCIYSNIDGISNKTAELSILLKEEKPDFVFITETKLNAEFLNSNIFDTKIYNVYRKDRSNQAAQVVALLF